MAFRVLIVDDSPAMRRFIARVLDVSGFPVSDIHEAADGRQALDVLEREWVDVILTDINMPGMNGAEMLEKMSQNELMRQIPVLVVSTDATVHRIVQMRQLGARGYLSKPFSPEELRAELEQVVGVESAGVDNV
jgi:two-component system, chemotaxis family, chemotaxis protein CheY